MGYGLEGDRRIVDRLDRVLEDIVRSGSVVVRKLSRTRAAEVAAHRVLGSAQVAPEAILVRSGRRTGQACQGRRIVVAQDTTEINFSGADRGRRGLGPAGDGRGLGFFVHALVAIDAEDEAVLGLVGAQIWTRAVAKVEPRQKRHLNEKESQRWIDGVETADTVLAQAESRVVVGDRESDVYQLFTRRPARTDLIVRSRCDRKLATDAAKTTNTTNTAKTTKTTDAAKTTDAGGFLHAAGASFPIVHEMEIKVAPSQPRALGDTGRAARVAVSFGTVAIAKPKTGRACDDPGQTGVAMVVVQEIVEPGGAKPKKPILWRLLTTLPVKTAGDALEIVRLYRLRWRIEQVFRALKSDGLALGETQIETAGRLFNLAALALEAAARIIQLTDARDQSRRPARDVLEENQFAGAEAIGKSLEGKTARQQNPHRIGSLSWLSWIVARLGGWNCYYKPPGPKTMADGWTRLAQTLVGYKIAKESLP